MKDYKARLGPKGRKPARKHAPARSRPRPAALPKGFAARRAQTHPAPPVRERRRRVRPALAALGRALRRIPLQPALYAAALAWLAAGLGVGGLALWRAPLEEVRLSGRELLPAEVVLNLGGLAAGVPMTALDPYDLATRIAAHPRVRSADVRRLYPGRVAIRLVERRPQLRVALHDGRTAVLDAQDVVLAVLPRQAVLPPALQALPVVAGVDGPVRANEVLRDGALRRGRDALKALAELLPPADGPARGVVRVESADPFLLSLRLPDGPRLVLPPERLRAALRTYRALTERLPQALHGMGTVDFSGMDATGGGRIYLRKP